jgi:hypothetical protein
MRLPIRSILLVTTLLWTIAFAPAAMSAGEHDILPVNFSAWTATGPEAPVLPGTASPSAAISEEYGLASATVRTYSRGADSLQITVYRLKDPTGAYGFYSYLRGPDFHRTDITEHSAITPDRALVLEGSLVLDVTGKNMAGIEPDLKGLAAAIALQSAQGQYPTLYGHLPQSGFIADSDRYILGPAALHEFFPVGDGDWLGFASGVEAEVAKYRINGEEVTLLIADFPTPQSASKRLDDWGKIFNLNGAQSAGDRPVVYAKRSLTLVGLVYGAHSAAQAAALLGHVRTGAELTWNEPGFSIADANMPSTIVGIIYGTGFLCMFALVAGLAFGGVRLVVKRLLPGRVFDRADQLNVLQLGLGSKPINSDDFYGFPRATRQKI